MPYKDREKRLEASKRSSKKWAKLHPEEANAKAKAWRLRNQRHMLHLTAKRRAEQREIEFDLSLDDIPEVPEICPIALIPIFPRNEGKRGPCDNSPTLDRVDPTKGYIKGNVRVISHRGNRWKSEMNIEDVRRLLRYVELEGAETAEGQEISGETHAG